MAGNDKGVVCVTGGTGFLASWLIMKLLQNGYSVHTTIRDINRDISFLRNLPGASERLQIFVADLEQPDSFDAAVEGCTGVFLVAHPGAFDDKEPEEMDTKRRVNGALGILKACLNAKTVKRVVYTSSAFTVLFNDKGLDSIDESAWTDVDFVKALKPFGASYIITKTLIENTCLEFAEKNGLDFVSLIPSMITGPFICPRCPGSVYTSLAMIFGDKDQYKNLTVAPMVHVDDAASAHIFLLEYPEAKGRYICSAVEITVREMSEFLSARYPEYQIPKIDSSEGFKYYNLSSKKLLDSGFTCKNGLNEIYDEAIQCCKEKGLL
ncbi:vestitone reductase-like isoform X1 [Cornus florida]|uniref:vestitone reductase-like isoform X1 n=1 Tax=Cornus florida TaxID=4283 RepID=UPI002898A74F|nr:vestitone reductase-like isoform X1 [Cornus florida]